MNEVKIDGTTYVPKTEAVAVDVDGLKYVIVRCRNAGVHAGYLAERNAETLTLKNSRRLWRWWSKFSLSGLATEGPLQSKMNDQIYACVLPEIDLTTSDVCEVIPCSEKAAAAIQAVPEHINE